MFLKGSDLLLSVADVIAVWGDPPRDIRTTRRVAAVWQEGRRLDLTALRAAADAVAAAAPVEFSEEQPPFGIYA